MVDDKQIKQWLKDGTITKQQADKMLADSSRDNTEKKSVKFIGIIATIGSILIAIGFAWLIAKNWHQIPDPLKVLILVAATLGAFTAGVLMRTNNHEGIGRSLLVLGALLYILSLFLISQTYNLATTIQHYTWLVFLAWTMIILTAYLLDSKENLVLSMWIFFPWLIMQYYVSVMDKAEMGIVMAFVVIFISAGALLYGLSLIHKNFMHKFAGVYRYWTVFYFLLIVFLLSFQIIMPFFVLGFEAAAMTPFVIALSIICIAVFAASIFLGIKNQIISSKEILIVLGIIAAIFILTLLPQLTKGTSGNCSVKSCYSYLDEQSCESAPIQLFCEWGSTANIRDYDRCMQKNCYTFRNESSCNIETGCIWQNNYCSMQSTQVDKTCNLVNINKKDCESDNLCQWNPSYPGMSNGKLPAGQYFLWILNNILLVAFIILIVWYGQQNGEKKIINLALFFFVIDIISRYIGFWMDFSGYLGFSLLSIIGGVLLILGAWLIPKLRRKLLEDTKAKP